MPPSKVTFLNPRPSVPRPAAGAPFRLSPYTPQVSAVPDAAAHPCGARAASIATRILLVSDTHVNKPYRADDAQHPFKAPLPRADVLIHAGDLTNWGSLREMHTSFEWLAAADAELKLVIAGNHDCGLEDPQRYLARARRMGPTSRSGRSKITPEDERKVMCEAEEIRELWTGDKARAKNIAYLEEGTHRFCLSNGAAFTVYASPYTPEYYDWAFLYPRTVDRFNPASDAAEFVPPNPIPSFPEVDIVVTHGPAQNILDRAGRADQMATHVGCEHLLRALGRARPRLHVFGHIHEDWGVARVDWHQGKAEYLLPSQWGEDLADKDFQRSVRRGWIGWRDTTVHADAAQLDAGGEDVDGFVRGEPLRWGRDTLCVNASIMTGAFNPLNSPWLVDLMLPAKESDAAE